MTPLLKFIVLCGVIETGILFNNFVSCNIFGCWELLHSSSRQPLDKVVTLFSFPEIFSLLASANLNGLVRVKDCDESLDVALNILQSFLVVNCNRLHYMISLFGCHFVYIF